ncbi:MAG TPA: tetratricopeptide repeat protein [Halanaerobiales bacterium]|nr:tetratricopeptide repeat protein [Halanaerobiales bacterium]
MKNKLIIVFLLLLIFISPQIKADDCLNNYEMGNLLYEVDLYDEALECYNISENSKAIIKSVQILLNQDKPREAINTINKYIENNDDYSKTIYYWLSRSYIINNELDKAEKFAIKFNQNQNKNPDSYILLGDVYYEKNMNEKAKIQYKKAIDQAPGYSLARYRSWNVSIQKEDIKNWLRKHPEDYRARLILADYYKKNNEKQISELQKLLGKGLNINKFIAETLFYNGNLKEASLYYIKYLQQEPQNSEAISNLIKIYLRMGEEKKANSIMESYPLTYDNLLLKALRERVRGNLNDAVFYYWKYIENNKKNADAYVGVAYTYLAMRKNELAIRDFKSAIFISPNYKDAYLGLLNSLEKENKYKEIIYWSNIAINRFDNNREILLYRAKAFMEEDRTDLSLNILQDINYNKSKLYIEAQNIKIISLIKEENFKKAVIESENTVDNIDNNKLKYYKVLYFLYKDLNMTHNSKIYKEKIDLYYENSWDGSEYNLNLIINLLK